MNALADNDYTRAWARLGASTPAPRAILAISAHWYLPATQVTAMAQPQTIHDFYGFPQALFDFQYPAPGDPVLAQRVLDLLADIPAQRDERWGLDHGTWGVLCHVYPQATIPVIQLSMDSSQPPAFHYAVGKQLAALRADGIMILGSGNIVHNLGRYQRAAAGSPPYDWALRFEQAIRHAIATGDHATLINYQDLGADARLACPTPEHYLPLLYIMALQQAHEPVSVLVDGIDGGSISMLSVRIG